MDEGTMRDHIEDLMIERDRLLAELRQAKDALAAAEHERDRLRSDVSRLQQRLATGDTED